MMLTLISLKLNDGRNVKQHIFVLLAYVGLLCSGPPMFVSEMLDSLGL